MKFPSIKTAKVLNIKNKTSISGGVIKSKIGGILKCTDGCHSSCKAVCKVSCKNAKSGGVVIKI